MDHGFESLYSDYLTTEVLTPFYRLRMAQLEKMRLETLLKRKNPYLFRAKNIRIASELVRSAFDAFLSSQEETVFGNLMEGFAIYVSSLIDNGRKSAFKSVDLEFTRDGICYLVGIKSGIYWGNSDQIAAMKRNFRQARSLLAEQGVTLPIVAVNGCIYGKDANPLKGPAEGLYTGDTYYKYAGQAFWHFLSGDEELYQKLIVPIGEEAARQDEAYKAAYAARINQLTIQFSEHFMTSDNQIDWVKLIEAASKRPPSPKV